MKTITIIILGALYLSSFNTLNTKTMKQENQLPLGAFSVSLAVKDLKKSKEFYENLGFSKLGGDEKMNYLIMKNGETVIGLFQGMFKDNILTFNPGWDQSGKNIKKFKDIRNIQKELKAKGISFVTEAPTEGEGPASFIISDPDGNTILFDQHR